MPEKDDDNAVTASPRGTRTSTTTTATTTKTTSSSSSSLPPTPHAPARPDVEADLNLSHVLSAVTTKTQDTTSRDLEQGGRDSAAAATPRRGWLQRLNPVRRFYARFYGIPPIPEERTVSKEYSAGFWSQITFDWMSPLMMTGYLRPLELQDIWLVNPNRSLNVLAGKLEASFNRRVQRGDRHPLAWAIYETFKFEFLLGGICQLVAGVLQVMAPFTSRFLIKFATDAYVAKLEHLPAPEIGRGIGLAIGLALMQVVLSFCSSQFFFRGMMVGGQARAVLIELIFSKATRLSARAKAGGRAIESGQDIPAEAGGGQNEKPRDKKKAGPKVTPDIAPGIAGDGTGWPNGKIVTLMSVDTDRIDKALGLFHILWVSPIIMVLALIMLLVNITYSALAGYALLVAGVPLLTYATRSLIRRRRKINKVTDQRVSLTQEILQAVRFVKYFGWENSFLERLKELRRREIFAIQVVMSIRNALLSFSLSLPVFASMLAFITYSLSKHVMTPAPIFSSLALFNALRMPLNMFPLVLGQVTDAYTAICRIQEFFLAEEQADDIKSDPSLENAIEVNNASFTWERVPTDDEKDPKKPKKKDAPKDNSSETPDLSDESNATSGTQTPRTPFQLKDLTFTAGRNELLAVIGTVGCGKSSLLAALAGDMRMTEGSVTLGASRAFCPQYPWIQNATVKDNILFGKEYDEKWYNQVVDACALRADLEMLPAGDRTEIGERGITVSGGQKQRLNIARAIYFNADIVLMDDPLSAVDAHVGRHIMDQAICGLLKDKCRILATHQLHVLHRCDRIILMNEGRIECVDTFDNLMQNSKTFQRLMATTAQEEGDKEKKEGEENDEDGPEPLRAEGKRGKKSKSSKTPAALMQQEERAVDSVSWGVWKAYISAFGLIINFPLIALTLVLANCANIMTSMWLTYWISDKFGLSMGGYIGIYCALGFGQVLFTFAYSTTLSTSGTNASKVMLQRAMTRVLRAPMSFFDTTPLGRITNRFSKDIHTMDNDLTDAMRMFSITVTLILSVIIMIIVFYPYFAAALVPLFIMFLLATNFYRASAREIKRHEAVLRSVVFSQFSEAVNGIASIRAYGLQNHFIARLRKSIDNMNSAYFLTFSNQRWLSIRLDAVGCLMIFVLGILVVTSRFDVDPSISGLVLSYILAIVQMLQFTIRQLAEVENNMNATERLHYYGTELEQEPPLHLGEVDKSWPQSGSISFTDVQMRYRPGLPLVLRGLNMEIRGGERIGIVGRTGAGKSSIMSALFRLTELSGGCIKIDGVDISKIGLYDLRSRLAIIPQDPALFRGTVRSNLDPFNEHTDLELWSALRKADLVGPETDHHPQHSTTTTTESPSDPEKHHHHSSSQRIHLDTTVDEEGLNFSLGQRQLMALARALVRDSRIIVCDEATSSVDFETDQKIQRTMAEGFKGKTVLCIAHRLRTIIDYDRICVMDQGQIAEMDTPLALWKSGGVFRSMCDRSGIVREDFTGSS
ncbi:hypothetical protein VTO42DRAFT_5751 [Malbranchea cinnamomea]